MNLNKFNISFTFLPNSSLKHFFLPSGYKFLLGEKHCSNDKKVRHSFASKVASLFKELPDFTVKSAVITSAAASCGCKHVGGQMGSEKRTAWWNQEVKEAIIGKKAVFRAWLLNKSSQQLQLSTWQYIRLLPLLLNYIKKSHRKNLDKS